MKCFICQEDMFPYFKKSFNLFSLGEVEYVKCSNCGLVVSKTHFQMSESQWRELNEKYHSGFFGTNVNVDDQKWVQRLENQRDVIKKLSNLKMIPKTEPWVDWGCGDGKLSDLLCKESQISLLRYDRYLGKGKGYLSEKDLFANKFSFVITTSVFEHVRSIEPLEEINSLVAPDGILATHTMVMEQIPRDPEWHYLLPVHCTFYSNKSMQILFNKWKYNACLYHPKSRLWFFLKYNIHPAQTLAVLNNGVTDKEDLFYYKRGFMDYWK